MTPQALVHRHLDSLLNNLGGALDGDVDHVHDARVATRRLREALPLIDGLGKGVLDVVKSAGRHLGTVRDLDVMGSRLDSLGSRIPTDTAVELHTASQAIRSRQRQARRAMVKALEQLDLWALRDLLTSQHGRLLAWLPRRTARRHWTRQVWTRIGTRSEAAAVAADHTPAIYMPNRAHRARIAVKKLRYAIEVAADMQIWRPGVILKDLRRLQDTLGEVHDLQVLVDSLDGLTPEEQRGTSHSSPMRVLLEDDIARRYAEYIKRRDRIGRIAEACARAARSPRWRLPVPLVVASAFTAPLVIESIRPWRPEKASELHD